MYKKIFILICILVLFLGISAAAAGNQTIEVNGTSVDDIRDAVETADYNSTIELNGEYDCGSHNYISVENKTLTFKSGKTPAKFTNLSAQCMDIYDSNITFKDLTFTEGWKRAISITGGNLNIINCTFENITSVQVYGICDSLSVVDCKFSGSYSGIGIESNRTNISNCQFRDIEFEIVDCISADTYISNCVAVNCGWMNLAGNCSRVRNSKFELTFISLESDESYVDNVTLNGHVSAISNFTSISNCNFTSGRIEIFNNGNEVSLKLVNSSINNSEGIRVYNNVNAHFILVNNTFSNDLFDFYDIEASISDSLILNNTVGNDIFNWQDVRMTNTQIIANKVTRSIFYFALLDLTNSAIINNTYEYIREDNGFGFEGNYTIINNIISGNFRKNHEYAPLDITLYYEGMKRPDDSDYYVLRTFTDIRDNFIGFNIDTDYEHNYLPVIGVYKYYVPKDDAINNFNWVNVVFEKINDTTYALKFINREGQSVNLPDYRFMIQNKTSKEIIAEVYVTEGVGTFSSNVALTLDDIDILNDYSKIVTKPKTQLIIERTGSDNDDTSFKIRLLQNNTPLANGVVRVIQYYYFNNEKHIYHPYDIYLTNANGEILLDRPFYDTWYGYYDYYDLEAYFADDNYSASETALFKFPVKKVKITTKVSPLSVTYNSHKNTKVEMISKTTHKGVIQWTQACFDVYKGKKLIDENFCELYNGKGSIDLTYLDAGTYTILVYVNSNKYDQTPVRLTLKIEKAKATVKASKLTAKFKKSKYFKMTVKANKKPVKKVVLKVKIGKKTYNVKTDKKGVAKFNTKKLKVGTHKVVITSGDKNYKISAKSKITIKR
jgi:hypothetical protein